MDVRKRGVTTDMQVTSIRLEPELKERLREISGDLGYQTLIRKILWQFVEQQAVPVGSPLNGGHDTKLFSLGGTVYPSHLSSTEIQATVAATAQQEQRCALTGDLIRPQQPMWLGLTRTGALVPLSRSLTLES